MTNEIIDVKGDQATAWSKWTYLSRNAENRPVPVIVGHYDDTLVRENGEWKFQKRVVWGEIPLRRAAAGEVDVCIGEGRRGSLATPCVLRRSPL